jgi:hypothetical protein
MSSCCTCKEKGQQALGLQQKLHKHLKKSWQQRPSDFHDGNNKKENSHITLLLQMINFIKFSIEPRELLQ